MYSKADTPCHLGLIRIWCKLVSIVFDCLRIEMIGVRLEGKLVSVFLANYSPQMLGRRPEDRTFQVKWKNSWQSAVANRPFLGTIRYGVE